MPAHNRLRPNDRHRIEHTRYEPVEPYEDKAVEPAEGRALMATPTQQYIQLMTKRYHLCLKRLSRPEEVDDHPLEQMQELEHPEFMARFGPSRQADGICDRDRRLCRSYQPRSCEFHARCSKRAVANDGRKAPFNVVGCAARAAGYFCGASLGTISATAGIILC